MRRLSLIVIVAFVLSLAGLGWSFAASPIAAATLEARSLPAASPPPGMSLSALPTADMSAQAAFAFRGGSFGEPRTFAQTALLVRHPRGDLLIDTGLGVHAREHFARTSFQMRATTELMVRTPAIEHLRRGGYDVAALAGILPTHVHWDHISGVPDFPGVPVWLNDVERAFAAHGGEITALMRSFGAVPTRRYTFDTAPYLGFTYSLDLYGDGAIVLVPAPGHTPGSIVVFLTLPSGRRLALLGDLVWQLDGIERRAERPWLSRRLVDDDPAGVRTAIAQVAAIHARFPEITLVPAHDARVMAKIPVFPARME